MAKSLFVIIFIPVLINAAAAGEPLEQPIVSGDEISFVPEHPCQNCTYSWTASDGDPLESNSIFFNWTAPIVPSETIVIVTLTVENAYGCTGSEEEVIIVRPATEEPPGKIEVEKTVDWNSHPLDKGEEFEVCLNNDSWKSCKTIGPDGGVLVWDGLAPGEYTVRETDPGLNWTVYVVGSKITIDNESGLSKQANVTNIHSGPIPLESGLEVSKIASPVAGVPGTMVTFTIVVKNTGEVPLSLEVNDTLPAGIGYVSADPVPDSVIENADGTATIFWGGVLGTLGPGNETTIFLVGKIGENIPSSASTTDQLTILGSADLGREEHLVGEDVLWVQQAGGRLAEMIEGLIWMRVRLEIELRKMVELSGRFERRSEDLRIEAVQIGTSNYTAHNYTDPKTGDRLVLFIDAGGNLTGSLYQNLSMDAVLTTEYGPFSALINESYVSFGRREGLRIDYDLPFPGYKIRTVTNYETGDTLIETVNPEGEVIRRDYRRTPGIPKFKEFRLRNSVTAVGISDEGVVSDSDYSDVTVNYLSDLKLKKVASPIPAMVGAVITYTYAVENTGMTTIKNLTLFDDQLNREIPLNRTTLGPGEVATGTADYTVVTGDLPGPIVNEGRVKGTDPQGDAIEDADTAMVPLYVVTSEIVLTKTPDRTEVAVGEVVTYSFVVENVGTAAVKNLTLFDDRLNGSIALDRTTLDPGEVATGTADYIVLAGDRPGPVVNNATVTGVTVTGTDEDGPQVSAEDSAEVRIKLPPPPTVKKYALQKTVMPGDEVTYIIEIKGTGNVTVNVNDTFNRPVEFVSADPRPSAVGDRWQKWDNITIEANIAREITLVVRTPKTQDFAFDMAQSVSGMGFVKVANEYKAAPPSYVLTNRVTVTLNNSGTNTTTETVLVGEAGTELYTRESGSGTYENEELVRMMTLNKSISMEKDVSATYTPTTLGLYNGRIVEYSSRWSQEARAKNRLTGASMTESYRYATFIDRESSFFVDQNESVMEINSEFDGMAEIGFFKMPSNTSDPKSTPTFELREDYVGSFKVLQKVEEYGKSASSEKSAAGAGLVVGDRRIGSSQRSYESGTGNYDSQEIIKTSTNYIAKEINLTSAPMSQNLTDDVSIDASGRWKEGMYSKTPGLSYIGEEYTSIDRLDKESVFRGLNDLSTEADFVGSARYRVVVADGSSAAGNGFSGMRSGTLVDFDEVYSGDYSIARRILLTGVPKYDHPHISLSKVGEGNANLSQVHYTITVANDGNAPLENVTIEDTFPRGTAYLSSSRRPDVIAADRAIWSVGEGLSVGGVLKIDLTLDVTESAGGLVNVVKATANAGNDTVLTASNFSVLEAGWLSCCPNEIFASKTAEIDPVLKNVVLYRLTVQNLQEGPIVARIEDTLPQGMALLGSSMMPSEHDRSSGLITWVVTDLKEGEIRTIDYLVEASRPGRYLNVAEVDPFTVDGREIQLVRVTSVVEIGSIERAEVPSGWVPPDWGFNHTALTCEMTCEELLSL